MTPLACAIFSKTDVIPLTNHLYNNDTTKIVDVLQSINISCQPGAHYLKGSKFHIAVVAVNTATKNMKDDKIRNMIIGKVCKQYNTAKKPFDHVMFEKYSDYATGGVPIELSPEKLIKIYDEAQLKRSRLLRSIAESTLKVSGSDLRSEVKISEEVFKNAEAGGSDNKSSTPTKTITKK